MSSAPVLRCHACGYDLRGSDALAACPECAEPVARSIDAAAPLSGAQETAASAGCLLLGAGLFGAAVLWVFHARSFADPWRSYPGTAQAVVVVAGFFAAIAISAGAWLVTLLAPRPLQVTARVGMLAHVPAAPALMVAWTSGLPWLPVVTLPLSVAAVAGLGATLLAVQRLARRMGRPALAVQLRIVAIGIAGSAASLCFAATFWYVPDDPRTILAVLCGPTMGVGLVGTAGFGLWTVVLLAAVAVLGASIRKNPGRLRHSPGARDPDAEPYGAKPWES